MPVDLGFESEHPRAGIQDHPLLELRRAELADEPDRRAQGTLGLDLHRRERGDIHRVKAIVRVDIPGVPVLGVVFMQLEKVAARAGREDFSSRLLVVDRREKAVFVPSHAEQTVLHDPAGDRHRFDLGCGRIVDRPPSARGRVDPAGVPVDLNDLATRMRVRVEDHQVVTDTGHGGLGGGDDASGRLDHRLELALGVLVHPVDARAGQDVVELVDEEALPGLLQDAGRNGRAGVKAPVLLRRRQQGLHVLRAGRGKGGYALR